MLLALSTVLLAWGWIFHPRGSYAQLLIGASSFVAVGALLKVISFLTAIPFAIGEATIYVEPYGAHTTMVLIVGPLLALYGLLFYLMARRERAKRGDELASGGT